MKKFIFVFIFLLVAVIGISQYNKIYNSFYVDGDGFKSISIEDKFKLLNDINFKENCSDKTLEKAVMLLTEEVFSRGSVEDKIDLLDNSDFTHFATDDLRKRLIESIVDTPNITSESYSRFLFRVCRSIDLKIVADRIEEKKYVLPFKTIDEITNDLKYISNNDEDKRKWVSIVERNNNEFKKLVLEKADRVIESTNFANKVEFFESKDYAKYLSSEIKEKLMESILTNADSEDNLVDFLFNSCRFEDFELAGKIFEKKGLNLKSKTVIKIKNEINDRNFNSLVWQRLINKYSSEKQIEVDKMAKPIIENTDFSEKISLYSTTDFLYFASDETKIRLIDSMSSMDKISKNKLISFLFNTCSENEFDFISKRIADTGCRWDQFIISDIKNNIRKSNKKLNRGYWDSISRNYIKNREKKAKEAFERIKISSSLKEKIELSRNSDFSFASFEVRKELALLTAMSAINEGNIDEKITVFLTGNSKYTSEDVRKKLLNAIVNDPNLNDNQLRNVFLSCKGEERKIAVNKMVEKKTFLPKNYIARLIDIDYFRFFDKESITKLFQDNPVGKRQLVVQAREMLQYRQYYKLLDFTKITCEILKIKPDSDLYKDIETMSFIKNKPAFRPNLKKTESQFVENKDAPIIKARILEHFNNVLAEYDEEIKNSPSAKDSQSDSEIEKDVRPGLFERIEEFFLKEDENNSEQFNKKLDKEIKNLKK